jgi:hypothetical protein
MGESNSGKLAQLGITNGAVRKAQQSTASIVIV